MACSPRSLLPRGSFARLALPGLKGLRALPGLLVDLKVPPGLPVLPA